MASSQTTTPLHHQDEPFVGLYTMFYRHLTNHLQSKNFRHSGDLKSARARAETYCNLVGAKLNFVQPLISDLSKEELFFQTGKFGNELNSNITSKDEVRI